MTIQELLNLAGQQGKVVVVDEAGELKAVLLSGEQYLRMSEGIAEPEIDPETINQEILRAQLEEVMAIPGIVQPMMEPPERIDSVLSRRAEDLFRSMPANVVPPEVATQDDLSQRSESESEEIKPNFDDI